MTDFEKRMATPEIVCPTDDFTCPYWVKGVCTLENAKENCDDFFLDFGEDDAEDTIALNVFIPIPF